MVFPTPPLRLANDIVVGICTPGVGANELEKNDGGAVDVERPTLMIRYLLLSRCKSRECCRADYAHRVKMALSMSATVREQSRMNTTARGMSDVRHGQRVIEPQREGRAGSRGLRYSLS